MDLKPLNKYVQVRHFRMESLRSIIASMEKGEYLVSIDIQDTYLHIPIAPAHQRFLRIAIDQDHYQFVALPFGLATAPRVFTKVMAATMDVLHSRGIVVVPYLDDLLVKAPTFKDCEINVSITIDTLSRIGWLVNLQKSSPTPSQSLTFLGMLFNTSRGLVLLPKDKALALRLGVRTLLRKPPRSLRFAMRVLGRMGAAIEAVPFAHFCLRPLQLAILKSWAKNPFSLDREFRLTSSTKRSLHWWLKPTSLTKGKSFLTGVDNWEADFLSRQGIDSGEWSLHPEIFRQICHRWGTPDVDLMASHFNAKVSNFMARTHDPRSLGADALVQDWTQFQLLYIFPPLPLISRVARKIKQEGVPTILIAPDWPRCTWYADIVQLIVDAPLASPRPPRSSITRPVLPPELRGSQFDGVALETWVLTQAGLSPDIIGTMIRAQKPASAKIYYRTWKAFFTWCESRGQTPLLFPSQSGHKGLPASKATLARWIKSTIQEDYLLKNSPLPTGYIRGLSTALQNAVYGPDDERINKIRYILQDARFFLIKSNNHENVSLAKAKGVWSTLPVNEKKLNAAFKAARSVILVFSVRESGKFQGFARLSSESHHGGSPIHWVLPAGMNAKMLGGVFKIDWICRRELPFTKSAHLANQWNEHKPVKIGRDGQEIEPDCGTQLCLLFPTDESIDLYQVIHKMRHKRRMHSQPRSRGRPSRREATREVGRRRPEDFDIHNNRKKPRVDYPPEFHQRQGFVKDPRFQEVDRRFTGVRRDVFLNGSYNDYVREFHNMGPPPPWQGMPQYPAMEQPPHHPYYQHHAPPPQAHPQFSGHHPVQHDARYRDKRVHDYDMRVDDFLRRTQAVVSSRRSRPRERERERERERPRDNRRDRGRDRDRDRDRERLRDRDRGDRGRYRR
ncbi:unnamed protein product [Ranitomeya imitator]|uniref:ribonuclease H n=1 Tax=Ranitomeya imitator TaxID=111125 RepID=A0ABN9KTA5_9NEOB|nr:unnamed protein product [Ranitomeya imitator]